MSDEYLRCTWNAVATALPPRHFEHGAVTMMACLPNTWLRAWLESLSSKSMKCPSAQHLVATLSGEPLYTSFGYAVVEKYDIPLTGAPDLRVVRMAKQLRSALPSKDGQEAWMSPGGERA